MSHAKPFSEEFLRRIVRENRSQDMSDSVRLWEHIPEKKQKKILKSKWLPEGVQPIAVALYSLSSNGFALCTDSVIYGRNVDFPGDKVSLVGLVGFDDNYVLTYEDGSEVALPRMYFCQVWLREIFRAAAWANAGPQRELYFPPEGKELSLTLPAYSVRRMPEFWLPEEMPPHLWAKLQRAFPDLPKEKVLGYCDLPESRKACIVLTRDSILQHDRYGHVTEIHFKEWNSLFFSDPEEGKIYFLTSKTKEELDEEEDRILKVPQRLLRAVEELVDNQYTECWWTHMRGILQTERITRSKADFVCSVRRRLLDYERDHSLCPEADNPKALKIRAAFALTTGYYEDALFYYELQRRTLCDVDHLSQWAYAGFMCYFYQPLSVTSVRWMLFYLLQFENPRFLSQRVFLDRWKAYRYENWETSLIDQRNGLAKRFNAAAEANKTGGVPILDGYVLDDCLKKMRK